MTGQTAQLKAKPRTQVNATLKRLASSWHVAQGTKLVLCLPRAWPDSGLPLIWYWADGHGSTQQGQVERLSDLPAFAQQATLWVWTPAEETLLTQARIPTRSRAKILQALPYALEEQLLGEPENLQFSYRPQADGNLAVAVTAKDRLQAWMGALQAAGFSASVICPISLSLPWHADHWALAFQDQEIFVRSGSASGFACSVGADREPPAALSLALREAREKGNAPQGLTVYNPPAGFLADSWSAILEIPVSLQHGDYLPANLSAPPLNLLQQEYTPGEQLHDSLKRLRPAAWMLAIWLLVGLGFDLWEWARLSHQHSQQRQEMLALFKNSFPEAKAIVDPALQMQRNYAVLLSGSGSSGPGDLLPLLSQAALVLQTQPQVQLRIVQYADGALTLELSVADFQAMETLKNALSARGMKAEVLSANNREGKVEGRLRIKPGTHS